MLTFLFVLALAGLGIWIMVHRFKTSPPLRPSPITSSPSSPPSKMRWEWLKEKSVVDKLKSAGIALLVFATFNIALWAGMSQFQNEWGKSYFSNSWMWSPIFLLLAMIVLILAFSKKENRFAPFVLVIAVVAFFATASAVLPGFFGPKPAEAETLEEDSSVLVMEVPRKLTFNVADSLPEVTDSLIEAHFGDLDDAVVDTVKWVAWAESGGKHWETVAGDSLVLVRGKNPGKPDDVGLFQVHEGGTHQDCLDAGHDYLTLEGNLTCARFLYNRRGFLDWSSSARVWRDRYSRGSTTDRTAEQIAIASRGGVESVIVDAPTNTMSPPIRTYGRKYCIRAAEPVAFEILDDAGNRNVVNVDGWVNLTRYANWLSFQSLGEKSVNITLTRGEPDMKCAGQK